MRNRRPQPSPELAGELIDAAKRYFAIGLNILPIGIDSKTGDFKKPLVRTWVPLKTKRMELSDLIMALQRPDATGLGLITGATSGNLHVRDFDAPNAFADWQARCPDLAKTLPIEKTGRPDGRHVFFRWSEKVKTSKMEDGELRGEGVFTVIAPSLHKSGKRYTWVRPFHRIEDVPIIDPARLILPVTETQRDGDTEEPEDTEDTEAIASISLSLCSMTPDDAIMSTLPATVGQRNRQIFELARRLKAIFPDRAGPDHEAHVREWHRRALATVGTVEWDVTWSDYLYAFDRVKHPHGQGTIDSACVEAFTPAALATVPTRYEGQLARKLYSLCWVLAQRSGVFFLSCHVAGRAIGTDHSTANRLLRRMVREKTLREVVAPTHAKATRYAFAQTPPQLAGASDAVGGTDHPAPDADAA